jgi:hypothetical protein
MSPKCSECDSTLVSHVGRMLTYIWYHGHVVYGPYPNPDPFPCSLVNEAFDDNGVYLKGSGEVRKALAEAIHSHKKEK